MFLPLSLPFIWKPRDPRLKNTFHLIAAAVLITCQETGPNSSSRLRQHLIDYYTSLHTLYPSSRFLPNHHYSLHLPEVMDLVGPLTSFAAWAGERVNHSLARVNTSNRGCESFLEHVELPVY